MFLDIDLCCAGRVAITSESEESESLEDEEGEWEEEEEEAGEEGEWEEEEEEAGEEGEGGWLASGVGDGREERLGDVSRGGADVSPGWLEGASSGRGVERALLQRLRLASMAEYDSLLGGSC